MVKPPQKIKSIQLHEFLRESEYKNQEYSDRFNLDEQELLENYGIPPNIANTADARLHAWNICELKTRGIIDQATEFAIRFKRGKDIIALLNADVTPDFANDTPDNLSIDQIIAMHQLQLSNSQANTLYEILDHITKNKIDVKTWNITGAGSSSIVLQYGKGGSAIKLSSNACYEYILLSMVKDSLKESRIVKVRSPLQTTILPDIPPHYLVHLENIQGHTLGTYLDSGSTFSSERTLSIGANIVQGLCELRSAGIFHHQDINLNNVFLEHSGLAKIIDLGIATTSKKRSGKESATFHRAKNKIIRQLYDVMEQVLPDIEKFRYLEQYSQMIHAAQEPNIESFNRRYGGPNDLVSVGQALYTMRTRSKLFSDTAEMSRAENATGYQRHRQWVYEIPERLSPYLQKVRDNIKDSKEDDALADIICACLTAKPYHLGKMRRMFTALGYK